MIEISFTSHWAWFSFTKANPCFQPFMDSS
jgi:hypothetical protein